MARAPVYSFFIINAMYNWWIHKFAVPKKIYPLYHAPSFHPSLLPFLKKVKKTCYPFFLQEGEKLTRKVLKARSGGVDKLRCNLLIVSQ